jgi:membrane-anchored mycosin MYCP
MRARHVALAVLAALAAAGAVPSGPAVAAPPDRAPQPYVLFYEVKKFYQGKPENLWEVATRFLGDANRAGEILELNTGRVQPDGARLSDPSSLHAGWKLVLPWDAIGTDLQSGAPAGSSDPASSGDGKPAAGCAKATTVGSSASWGQTLLAPARVWPQASGSGIRIAVVGSGTDAASPELAGRVAGGTDVVTGTGRGDTDCLGTGTAIAGIAAGDDGDGGKNFGLAPKATIVPIRVSADDAEVPARTAATAIQVATSTGAQVITVGAGVDAADPVVRAAIDNAIARDIVVVLPASATVPAAGDGLLRVGGVASDRKPAADYPAGSLDLVAPGVKVATVDRTGTGSEYAAAFVAGTVALLRSAHPNLRAADVTRQVLRTATSWSSPDKYGAGLVNPYAATATPLLAGAGAVASDSGAGGSSGVVTTVLWVLLWIEVAAAAVLLLLFGWRRLWPLWQARTARRARLAAEADDPFWQPPADGELPERDEMTARVD